MVTLAALIGQMKADGADLLVDAPENWSQGRTLYGGITAALCYEAAKAGADALPPLREKFPGSADRNRRMVTRCIPASEKPPVVRRVCSARIRRPV